MIFSSILIFLSLAAADFPICNASGRQWHPAVASCGERYLVVWEDDRATGDYFNNDIWGQFVSEEGTLIDTNFPICTADSGQWMIDIAFGDSNYLVVWCDDRNESWDVYGRLVAPNGNFINTEFAVCTTSYYQCNTSVAFGSINYLVVWQDHYDDIYDVRINAQRISSKGQIIDTNFTISHSARKGYNPAVAFDGENYLVVWTNSDGQINPFDVCGQFVNQEGSLVDTNFLIIMGGVSTMYPDIAFGGTNYLVVAAHDDTVFGQLVSTDGSLIGEPIIVAGGPESGGGGPSVVWSQTNYLVAFATARNEYSDIYGQWVSSDGDLIDTNFAISTAWWSYEYLPTIAYCGENCLVIWSDTRGPEPDYDIYGSIVTNVGIQEESQGGKLALEVYPNPLRYEVDISYQLPIRSRVSLKICDLSGRIVVTLINTMEEPGYHRITWNSKNLPDEVYFIKLEAGRYIESKKLILIN